MHSLAMAAQCIEKGRLGDNFVHNYLLFDTPNLPLWSLVPVIVLIRHISTFRKDKQQKFSNEMSSCWRTVRLLIFLMFFYGIWHLFFVGNGIQFRYFYDLFTDHYNFTETMILTWFSCRILSILNWIRPSLNHEKNANKNSIKVCILLHPLSLLI